MYKELYPERAWYLQGTAESTGAASNERKRRQLWEISLEK